MCAASRYGTGLCSWVERRTRSRERLSFQVLHREKQVIAVFPELLHLHHVAVADAGHNPSFVEKHLSDGRLAGQMGQEPLQDDRSREPAWPFAPA